MFDKDRYTKEQRKHFEKMIVVILSPVMFDYPKFWRSMVNMIAYSWNMGIRVNELGITERTVVDWARNDLAEQALDQKDFFTGKPFTHFLWLDTDHVFKPDLLCQLASHDVEAVSALYFSRLEPHKPVVYVSAHDEDDEYKHYPLLQLPPYVVKVDAFGFGACLMRREVFDKVPKPWFTIDYRAGEDISFCTRARKYGVELWVDGGYSIAHIGPTSMITTVEYNKWYEENQDEIKANREPVKLIGKEK